MKLDKWIEKQDIIFKNTYSYIYAEQVDIIFVQICSLIKGLSQNIQPCSLDLKLSDFEMDTNGTVKYIINEYTLNHDRMSMNSVMMNLGLLLYELLYRKKYNINIFEYAQNNKNEYLIGTLDLESEYQEFDNVMELLTNLNQDRDTYWEDFPVSTAKVEFIERETGKILDTTFIILEDFDEVYFIPREIKKSGNIFRFIKGQKETISYSFFNKKYVIYYSKIGSQLIYGNFDGEWGIITLNKEGKKIFTPFYHVNNTICLKLDIVPKVFIPYITIQLVRRIEGSFETDIDNNPNCFIMYTEILIYSKYDLCTLESLCIMSEIRTLDTEYLHLETKLFFKNSISEKIENTIQIL